MGSPHGHVIIILCPPHCILGFVWTDLTSYWVNPNTTV